MRSALTRPKMQWDALEMSAQNQTFPVVRITPRDLKLADYLDRMIHPAVTVAASLKDGGGWPDHGTEHVRTVIERRVRNHQQRNRFGDQVFYEPLFCSRKFTFMTLEICQEGHELGSASHSTAWSCSWALEVVFEKRPLRSSR